MSAAFKTQVSIAVELVARLYVSAHARTGDLTLTDTGVPPALPEGDRALRGLSARYFGDDFAIGTNLMATAIWRGWTSVDALVQGVAGADPRDLVADLLTSTTLSTEDRDRSGALVFSALNGDRSARATAVELARLSSFRRASVEHVLRDPKRAHTEVCQLLRTGASAFSPAEASVGSALEARVAQVGALLTSRGRESGLLELTGGWTLRHPDQCVVVVPTLVETSLVITRLLPDARLLLVFSGAAEPQGTVAGFAAVAHALGSEQRLAILQLVGSEPMTGQRLAEVLGVTEATVHYHTSMLRSVGLVASVRDAHNVFHTLDASQLRGALVRLTEMVTNSRGADGEAPRG